MDLSHVYERVIYQFEYNEYESEKGAVFAIRTRHILLIEEC